jgi:tetratricopeptide (TPR) repeat protein
MKAATGNLSQLEAAGLINLAAVQPEIEYMFRHSFFHEAAYASLVKQDKQRLHLAVGEALERLYPNRLEEFAPRLAGHFDRAGSSQRALPYYVQAGKAAARRYANAEAALNYSRAVEIISSAPKNLLEESQLVDLFMTRGRTFELTGRYQEALDNYLQMEQFGESTGSPAMVLKAQIGRAAILLTPTAEYNFTKGKGLTEQALHLARQLENKPAEARIYWTLLLGSYFASKFEDAKHYGENALSLARQLGLKEQLAFTLADFANFINVARGEFSQARSKLDEAAGLWRELNNLPMLADTLTALASIYHFLGDFGQALKLTSEAYEISLSTGNPWGQAYSKGMSGVTLVQMGEVSRVIAIYKEAEQLANEAGFQAIRAIGPSYLGYLLVNLGSHDQALQYASLGVQNAQESASFWLSPAIGSLIIVKVHIGEIDEARKLLEQAQRQRENQNYSYVFDVMLAMAEYELSLASGDFDHTISMASRQIENERGRSSRGYLPHALHYMAKALIEKGQQDRARIMLREAWETAEATGAYLQLWQILATLARLENERKDDQSLAEVSARGKQVIQYLLERMDDLELRHTFQAQPGVLLLVDQSHE